MTRRTTIELDEDLLARAKRVLGVGTTRATVEEALRRVVDEGESVADALRRRQLAMLDHLPTALDLDVLESEEMWR